MFYTLRRKKGYLVVTLRIISRDSLSDNLCAALKNFGHVTSNREHEEARHCNPSFKSRIHPCVVFLYVARCLLQFASTPPCRFVARRLSR